jgi:hypothetical protein
VQLGGTINPRPDPVVAFFTYQVIIYLTGVAPHMPLATGDLSQVPWDLSSLPETRVEFDFTGPVPGLVASVNGVLDSLTLTPLPESPVVVWSAALATLALAIRRSAPPCTLGFRRARS